MTQTLPYGILGRLPAEDPQDQNYLIKPKATTEQDDIALERGFRYWWQDGWWGDQWYTPQCVAYSWTHWVEDGPVTQAAFSPNRQAVFGQGKAAVNPQAMYDWCQRNDEWEGTNYDGTSVRAGAKYLKAQGFISEYRWAWDIDTLVNAVLLEGPVVVGTNWYDSMMQTDANGRLHIDFSGPVYGHAYEINAVNRNTGWGRIKNSWGRKTWGVNGNAYIRLDDLARLIEKYNGEVCLAKEVQR